MIKTFQKKYTELGIFGVHTQKSVLNELALKNLFNNIR